MTADGQPGRSSHRSGNSLGSEDAAPRRRHGPAHPAAQRSRSVSPVPELPPSGSHALQHNTSSDADSSDGEEQQVLSAGATASGRSRVRQHAADSGPAYQLAFDGIEGGDGPPSGASAGGGGALSTLARRHLPGLALFWDGITPELVAVSMVYVVQGLLDMTILAISYFLKDGLQMTPARAGLWLALGKAPWLVKPLWGFLSDAFPIAGYRRRSWLLMVNLIGTLGWVGLGLLAVGPRTAMLFLLATNLGLAFGDVIVDAIVVGMARDEPSERAGSLQSLCWGSRAVGSIASAWFGGWLVELLGPRPVLLLAAVFPAGVAATAFMITEQRVDGLRKHAHEGALTAARALLVSQATMLWSAISQRSVWAPMVFTFFWSAAPTTEPAMFFFTTNQLGFSPEFLGRIQLFAGVAELLGVWLYNRYLKSVPLRRVLGWTLLAGTASGATQLILVTGANRALGLSDKLFALGDSVIITALHRIALMPVFVLSARICPEGVEASLFATLMSIGNASMVTSASLGSGLTSLFGITATSFTHLPALVLLCALSRLLALPLLALLPSSLDTEDAPQQEELPLEPKADIATGPMV